MKTWQVHILKRWNTLLSKILSPLSYDWITAQDKINVRCYTLHWFIFWTAPMVTQRLSWSTLLWALLSRPLTLFTKRWGRKWKLWSKCAIGMIFLARVQKSGCNYEMKVEDFKMLKMDFSQIASSKQTRPPLESVSVAEFRKLSTSLCFKTSHQESDFNKAMFLKTKNPNYQNQ